MKGIRKYYNNAVLIVLCGCILVAGEGSTGLRAEVLRYRSQVQMKTLPEKMEKELIQTVTTLLDCFVNKNEKCVLNMLATKFEILMITDDYMTKKQVEKEFRTKGVYYAKLFDTDLHRKLSAANIKRLNESLGDDALHYNYSVSDVLKMAQEKNLRMSRVNIFSGPPSIGVEVNITCDRKNEDKILKHLGGYIFNLRYLDNKWYLTSLDIRGFY